MQRLKLWINNKDNQYCLIFLLLFIFLCLLYQYHKILFLRPQGIHVWRQTISLSYALNYYQQGMNFFKPEVHQLVADKGTTGYVAAEFPLLYFFNAILWKIFGVHEFIPRLLNLFLAFLGFFSVFKIIYKKTDAFWGILLPLLFFTSPVVAFYCVSALPDSPAFSIALISIFCFYKFFENQKYKWLYLFMFLSLICGLLKATSAMIFAAILMVFIFEKTRMISFRTEKKIFNGGIKDYLLFAGTLAGIAAWYFWAMHYNESHGSHISDSRILPIWNMNAEDMFNVIKSVHEIVWYQFFSPHTTFLFLLLFIPVIFLKRVADKYLWNLTMFLFMGTATYVLLWFAVWNAHDYYMFPLFFFFIILTITFFDYLKNAYPMICNSKILKMVFFLFFIYNVWYCSNNIRMRYGIGVGNIVLTSTNTEVGLWDWFNWDRQTKWKAYETIESHNRSLGIRPNDLVVSIPDPSVCVSLYLMNQKGWNEFNGNFFGQDGIEAKIKLGAKYLFLNDTNLCHNPFIEPYTKYKIGQYQNIAIYDLKENKK